MINDTSPNNPPVSSCTRSDEGTVEKIRKIKKTLNTVLPIIASKKTFYTENFYNAVSLEERTKQNSCRGLQRRIADSCFNSYTKLKKLSKDIGTDKSIGFPTDDEILNDGKLIWSKMTPKKVVTLYNSTNVLLKEYENMSYESLMDIKIISVKDDGSINNESENYPQSVNIWRLHGDLNQMRAPYFNIIINQSVLSRLFGELISDMSVKYLNNHLDVFFKAFCHFNIDEFAITNCGIYFSDLKDDALKESIQYRMQTLSNKNACYASIMTILKHTHRKLAEPKKEMTKERVEGCRIFSIVNDNTNKSALAMYLLNEHETQFKKFSSDMADELDINFYHNLNFNDFNDSSIAMFISGILLDDNEFLEAAIQVNTLKFKPKDEWIFLESVNYVLDLINNSLQFGNRFSTDSEFYIFDQKVETEKIEKLNLYSKICELLNFQIMNFDKSEMQHIIIAMIKETHSIINNFKLKAEKVIEEFKPHKQNKKNKCKKKKKTLKNESDVAHTSSSDHQSKIHEQANTSTKPDDDMKHPSVDYETQLLDPAVCKVIKKFHHRRNININSTLKQAEEATKIERLTNKEKATINFAIIEEVANLLDEYLSKSTKIKDNLCTYQTLLSSTTNFHDAALKKSNIKFKSDVSSLNLIISNLKTNIDYIKKVPSYKDLLTNLQPSETEKKVITQSYIKLYSKAHNIKIIFETATHMDRVYKLRGSYIRKNSPGNIRANAYWENSTIHTNMSKIKDFIDHFGNDMYQSTFVKFKTT